MAKKRNYDEWTAEDLHAEASRRDLPGRSTMSKDELTAALKAQDAGQTPTAGQPGEGVRDLSAAEAATPTRPPRAPAGTHAAPPMASPANDPGAFRERVPTLEEATSKEKKRDPQEMPPAHAGGPVPRFVDPSYRSPDVQQWKRFKIRDEGGTNRAMKYVLAENQSDAVKFFAQQMGLVRMRTSVDREGELVETPLEWIPVVTELPD